MLKLLQRTLVGQATDNQRSGVLIHPTQDLVVLYAVSSANAGEAFLHYCQEQFDHEVPQSSLELHQLLDRCISTAERMEVELSLVSMGVMEDRVVLAAYNGSVWLKRGSKVGQILSAESTLQLLEGKTQVDDVYALFTQKAMPLSALIQDALAKTTAQTAATLIELPELRSAVHGSADEPLTGLSVAAVKDVEAVSDDTVDQVELHDSSQPTMLTPTEVDQQLSQTISPPATPLGKVTHGVGKGIGGVRRAVKGVSTQFGQLFSQDVYVRQKHRRSALKVGLVLLALLLIAIGALGFWRNHRQEQQKQVASILTPYQTQFAQIKDLSVNDPVTARAQLGLLITEVEAKAQDQAQPKFVQEALQAQLNTIKEFNQSISGQTQLPHLPTFFDLRLVQSNFLASRIDVTAETLFFLDSGQRRILALNIEKKQPTLLPIGEYPDIRALVANDEFLYFLGQGLFRFTLSGTEVASIVENSDDVITDGQSLGLFDKYLYVLNKTRNNIFRYDTEDDKLDSEPTAWIQSGQGVDLNNVQTFAIDGDVWLSTQTGEILKLSGGRTAAFEISGLADPFTTPISIFTKPDLQNLYVLEPEKSRVVVLNKEGQFIKEIKSDELAGATAVVASEKHSKAFALSGSLVYEVGL
ncbi:hypothetical protein H3C66_00640 [Patescibacteria group bacterium]|nr:hypothetical protein [Patescibacteria group bacterium]